MPNNTTNRLEVNASKSEFEKIKKFVKSKEVIEGKKTINALDFNNIIPMPEELKNVTSPVHIVSQAEYDKAVIQRDKDIKEKKHEWSISTLPLTKEMQEDYLKKYGSDNWYDWAVKNWGTKWGAYDISKWEGQELKFFTAWSPPLPVIEKLSKKFPKAVFILRYADEGGSFVGECIFENGEANDNCLSSNNEGFEDMFCDITGQTKEEAFGEN